MRAARGIPCEHAASAGPDLTRHQSLPHFRWVLSPPVGEGRGASPWPSSAYQVLSSAEVTIGAAAVKWTARARPRFSRARTEVSVIQRRWRPEELDSVGLGPPVHLLEIDVDRLGGLAGARGQSDFCEEALEPGRGRRQQNRALPRPDEPRVHGALRHEHVRARSGLDSLVAEEDADLPVDDVERLVGVVVHVNRRRCSSPLDHVHLREPAGSLLSGDFCAVAARLPRDAGKPDVVDARVFGEDIGLVRDRLLDHAHTAPPWSLVVSIARALYSRKEELA